MLYRDDSQTDAPDSTKREVELTELSKNEDVRNCIDEHVGGCSGPLTPGN